MRTPEIVGSLQHGMSTQLQHPVTLQRFWNDARQWYVVQTKPHQERRVIAHLALRAPTVEPFLPKIEIMRKRSGRRIASLEPLFPSYVFLEMSLTPEMWQGVRWAPGTRRILGDGVQPIAVPVDLVQTIRDRVEALGFVRPQMAIAPGDRVRVKTGPFAGLEGIFERPTTRRDRVRVLLEMLGSVAPLEIDVFELETV